MSRTVPIDALMVSLRVRKHRDRPGMKTSAVLERHNVPVTLEGTGDGDFKVVIPREIEVEKGDKILNSL